jgi:hypothetical protein
MTDWSHVPEPSPDEVNAARGRIAPERIDAGVVTLVELLARVYLLACRKGFGHEAVRRAALNNLIKLPVRRLLEEKRLGREAWQNASVHFALQMYRLRCVLIVWDQLGGKPAKDAVVASALAAVATFATPACAHLAALLRQLQRSDGTFVVQDALRLIDAAATSVPVQSDVFVRSELRKLAAAIGDGSVEYEEPALTVQRSNDINPRLLFAAARVGGTGFAAAAAAASRREQPAPNASHIEVVTTSGDDDDDDGDGVGRGAGASRAAGNASLGDIFSQPPLPLRRAREAPANAIGPARPLPALLARPSGRPSNVLGAPIASPSRAGAAATPAGGSPGAGAAVAAAAGGKHACTSKYHARYGLAGSHGSSECPFCSTCHLLEFLFNGCTRDCAWRHVPTEKKVRYHCRRHPHILAIALRRTQDLLRGVRLLPTEIPL